MHAGDTKVLIDRDRIAARIDELGREISRDLTGLPHDGEVVLVPILTGSIIFVADLMRRLSHRVRIEVASVQSYQGEKVKSKEAAIIGSLPDDVRGKHVLIVDDILDSGGTIRLLREAILERGARSVRVCVLLRKAVDTARETPCEYVGFDISNEFVVGYGLDYDNYYRNLPEVAVLKKEFL